jgi:hypothetical protein
MGRWEIDGVEIVEVEFDYDLHAFEIYRGDELIHTITPASIEDMNHIKKELDNGESPDGWEDGMGNTIHL